MKIAFCFSDYSTTGGIERVSIVKMNALADRGHEVYAITTDQGDTPCYFPLDPRVQHIDLEINYCDFNGLSRPIRYFKSFAKKRQHKEKMTELLSIWGRLHRTILTGNFTLWVEATCRAL